MLSLVTVLSITTLTKIISSVWSFLHLFCPPNKLVRLQVDHLVPKRVLGKWFLTIIEVGNLILIHLLFPLLQVLNRCSGSTLVGSELPHSCLFTAPSWDRNSIGRVKVWKLLSCDKDSLKAKATCASKAKEELIHCCPVVVRWWFISRKGGLHLT